MGSGLAMVAMVAMAVRVQVETKFDPRGVRSAIVRITARTSDVHPRTNINIRRLLSEARVSRQPGFVGGSAVSYSCP